MDIPRNVGTEEITIAVHGGEHVRVKNLGESTVYVSKYPDIIIDNDNVIEIPSGCIDGIPNVCQYQIIDSTADYYGTIYAKSDGETKIEIRTQNNLNFRYIVKGGGKGSRSNSPIAIGNKVICIDDNSIYTFIGNYEETPILITSQPININGKIGDIVSFKVTAIGLDLTYQWQYSKDNSSWYRATSDGNTTDTLFITIRSSIFENYYRCVITDVNGNKVNSNVVRVFEEV